MLQSYQRLRDGGVGCNMDDLLTVGKAAKALNKTRMTIYRWIDDGKIIKVEIGGVVFIPSNEIKRLKPKK